MKKYHLRTMADDLAEARGKKSKPGEFKVSSDEGEKEIKPSPAETEEKKVPQEAEVKLRGGVMEEKKKEKKARKKRRFPLLRVPFLRNRKVIISLVLALILFGGGVFYFGFSSILPTTVREFIGVRPPVKELRVVKPNGGEQWQTGKSYKILWSSDAKRDRQVDVYYLRGKKSLLIEADVENSGKYTWEIPKDFKESDDYKIKLAYKGNIEGEDTSNETFSIKGKEEVPIDPEEGYDISPALIDGVREKIIELESEEELKTALEKQAKEEFELRSFTRLVFVLKELERELSPSEIFYYLGWGVPDSIFPFLGLDYNFFLYNQKELFTYKKTKRLALIFKVNQPQLLAERLIENEESLDDALLPGFFLNIEEGSEPLTENFLVNSESYPKVPIKYQNYPQPDLSIDYAVASLSEKEGFLLLSSSRESMYKLIDALKKKWELQAFQLPEAEEGGTASIKGKVCYPAGGIPEDWTPWAKNLETEETYEGEVMDDQYIIKNLPAGDYHIYAKAQDLEGRYSKAVVCGLTAQCTDHSFVKVTVIKQDVVENVDPCDWYYGQ